MMTDPVHDPDPDADVRAVFNDLVRSELATPRPNCECVCNGAEPHADRLCRRPATTLVALHRWSWCDQAGDDIGLVDPAIIDTDGNLTSMMCDRCADHAVAIARAKINLLLADPATYGRVPECPTCHRPTTRWQDILVRRSM